MLKTAHAYFYVQQGVQVPMAGLQKAAADFLKTPYDPKAVTQQAQTGVSD